MKVIKTASYIKQAKEKECKGWVAVRLNNSVAKEIQKWGKNNIPDDELNIKEGGKEEDTHITLFYGICTDNGELVKNVLSNEKPISATLDKIGCFVNNDGFDVVIIKVNSPDLERLNKKIADELNVKITHNKYKPHCTIAYVKKGNARKYAGNTIFQGKKIVFKEAVFKNSSKKETIIKFKDK